MTQATCTPLCWISSTSLAMRLSTSRIDAELGRAQQRLARELDEDAFVAVTHRVPIARSGVRTLP